MSKWDEDKKAAQTSFANPDMSREDAERSTDHFYQQLLHVGSIQPLIGHESLTQRIVDNQFPEVDIKEAGLDRSQELEQEQEQDIEAER